MKECWNIDPEIEDHENESLVNQFVIRAVDVVDAHGTQSSVPYVEQLVKESLFVSVNHCGDQIEDLFVDLAVGSND